MNHLIMDYHTINVRNYVKPNIEYSIFASKRPVGAFAIKGWISGK